MQQRRSFRERDSRAICCIARAAQWICHVAVLAAQPAAAFAGGPIDTGPYAFSSEDYFADEATITGVISAYHSCSVPTSPPYPPEDIALYVVGYTPDDFVVDVGQIDSAACSQNGQELELGFSDTLPYEFNGPDVVVFDGRPDPLSMAVSVRPLGESFGEPVLYGPDDNLATTLSCSFIEQWAIGIDFERHGLQPGEVVDRIKIIADCNITPEASEYTISMAAVVDRSCSFAEDCSDQNECTTDFCAADMCAYDPLPAGTPCATGLCDGAVIPHCVACLDDEDCDQTTPLCHPGLNVCVVCLQNAHCPEAAPVCDGDTLTCTTCFADTHCIDNNGCTEDFCVDRACAHQPTPAGTPCTGGVCDGNGGSPACIECIDDADCGGDKPFCRLVTDQCVECLNFGDCADDGDPCTLTECIEGVCIHQPQADCGAGDGGSTSSAGTGGEAPDIGGGGDGGGPPGDPDGCSCGIAAGKVARDVAGGWWLLLLAAATRRAANVAFTSRKKC